MCHTEIISPYSKKHSVVFSLFCLCQKPMDIFSKIYPIQFQSIGSISKECIVSQTFAYWTIFGKFLNRYRPSKIFPNFFCGQAIITTYNFCHLFMLQCVLNFFCINLLLGALASFRKTSIVDRCHRHFATQFTVKMK